MFLILIISLCSCYRQYNDIKGEWKVNSKFYHATYQIIEEDDNLNGLVLYYNDGTTKYTYDGTKRRYVFTGLKKEKNQYVDGISGATSKNSTPKSIEIKSKSEDTLEVTTYIMDKPLLEIWTRKQ